VFNADIPPGYRRCAQASNYRQFAEARAAQLGRSFEELTDPHRSETVSGAASCLLCKRLLRESQSGLCGFFCLGQLRTRSESPASPDRIKLPLDLHLQQRLSPEASAAVAAEHAEAERRRWRDRQATQLAAAAAADEDPMASSPAPGEAALAVSEFDAAGTAAMIEEIVREAVSGTAGNAIGETLSRLPVSPTLPISYGPAQLSHLAGVPSNSATAFVEPNLAFCLPP